MNDKSCDTCFYGGRSWDFEPCKECKGGFCNPRLSGFPNWHAFTHVPPEQRNGLFEIRMKAQEPKQ